MNATTTTPWEALRTLTALTESIGRAARLAVSPAHQAFCDGGWAAVADRAAVALGAVDHAVYEPETMRAAWTAIAAHAASAR
jgi:flavin-binding protein dodecin